MIFMCFIILFYYCKPLNMPLMHSRCKLYKWAKLLKNYEYLRNYMLGDKKKTNKQAP